MDTSEWIVVCTADTVCWSIIFSSAETGVCCWHLVQARSSTTASNPTSTTLLTTSSSSSGFEQHGTLHQRRNWQSHMAVTANCGLRTWVWSLQRAAAACCMSTWMMKVRSWQACRFDSSPCMNVIFSISVKIRNLYHFRPFQVPDVWVHLLFENGKRLGFYSYFVSLYYVHLCAQLCTISTPRVSFSLITDKGITLNKFHIHVLSSITFIRWFVSQIVYISSIADFYAIINSVYNLV